MSFTKREVPILEFDSCKEAVIEPSRVVKPVPGMPEGCVLCYFGGAIDAIKDGLETIGNFRSESLTVPIYVYPIKGGTPVAVVQAQVGAALAGGMLEELIAMGCKYFVCCGGAGVLQKDMAVGHLMIPTSAVRDEGVSYHYLPPARYIDADKVAVSCIEETLSENGAEYLCVRTWTTDAFYRETRDKVNLRVAEGCVSVEMEAAAYMAVSQFRGVHFGQILYAGDDLSGELWDKRAWESRTEIRRELLNLSATAVLKMKKSGLGGRRTAVSFTA